MGRPGALLECGEYVNISSYKDLLLWKFGAATGAILDLKALLLALSLRAELPGAEYVDTVRGSKAGE